ncbi:MAG: HAMP domain-containing histidine kinase [Nonomuraea sp.]|nr:HAMP domain-containing histidine kinase [Nonomuraea sp.]
MRARLALFASVAMALLCVVASSLLLWAVHNTAVEFRRNEVVSTALRVVHLIKRGELPPELPTGLTGLQVVDPAGRVQSSTPNLAGSPRLTTAAPDPDNANRVGELCDVPRLDRKCSVMVVFRVYEPDGDWLVYAFGHRVPWYVSPAVITYLAGVCVALVALTWFGVSRVVARTLAPVHRITERLGAITAGGGPLRVPVPENAEEIKTLAETANHTLDRLESAMEQQRRFASDASHDLRSPITAMRAQLEEALLVPEETDWPYCGRQLLASVERLQNIVTDLLTLTRLDARAPARLEPVDLAELVTSESSRPRTKKVVTALRPGVVVTGDRLRLARLLTNLLDNAERHADSTVTVTLRRDGQDKQDGQAVLEVLDDGAGIAPEHREVVFRRFTRLDASRDRDAGGSGLGLPIAREIAEIHGGALTIEDSGSGARFVLRLPVRQG